MIPMPRAKVHRVRPLFAEHLGFVVEAMAAGNTAAKVWVDDPAAPRMALIWDLRNAVYLAGTHDQADAWQRVFDEQIASTNPGFLKLHIPESAAETGFTGHALEPRQRVLYRASTAPGVPPSLRPPDGFRISSINERFDELRRLDDFDSVIAEIESCWPSVAAFRQSGFGFVAHDDNRIGCWCTAECVSHRACGIGIETLPAYQNRGFASSTAAAFLQFCAERGIVAHWDAWTDNLPSITVAEKLGLTMVDKYPIFIGTFDDGARQ